MFFDRLAVRFFLLFLVIGNCAWGQYGVKDGNWPHYGGDFGSTKYSALDQINAENFNELEVLWRWESPDKALLEAISRPPSHMVATPLVVDGRAFVSTSLSQVASIDVETGKTLWVYDPKSYLRGGPVHGRYQHRGVEYWTDGEEERIVIATNGRQLVSIDAKTGKPDPAFGDGGWVDLLNDLGRKIPASGISHNAPTAVVNDTIIVGSIINDGPLLQKGLPGHIRAYDVRTGEFKWRFHTVPKEGEFGIETWENESWKRAGNTNCWTMMSFDEELGYVYLPIGAATSDYYGGHRHGDNLFSQSVVCLNVETGERVWHYQMIHHDLWDYDLPAAPVLMDIVVDGKPIKALAQISKQAFTYVLDRATGEPIWPIEERAVPTHPVAPGEKASPTQPFPTKPPAFDRQGSTEDDVIDFTPEIHEAALKTYREYQTGPLYTPSLAEEEGGKKGTLLVPGNNGGGNWPGASIDPETGMFYVQSQMFPLVHLMITPRDPSRTNLNYHDRTTVARGPEGLPLLKGPYKQLTAIDMNKGDIVWKNTIGRGVADHPLIKHLNLDDMGYRPAQHIWAEGGVLVTKTLVIMPQADVDEANEFKARGSWLFAFDKATGEELGKIKIDRHLHSSPMTAMHNGRQYLLFSGGGRDEPAEVVAIGLPNPK
jgi:quinoprotein glucose dehydrogenase